jgi:hypothetical protein
VIHAMLGKLRLEAAKGRWWMPPLRLAGGCTFAPDPSLDYMHAAPIWSAALDPNVIRARAYPCETDTPHGLLVDRYEHHVAISPIAEHVLLRSANSSLRLDIVSGTLLAGPVLLEPSVDLEQLHWQLSAIQKLDALLRHVPLSREQDPRLPRLVLALRALDGRADGASLRDLASGIFGLTDWPGDGENVKSRARRLAKLAEKLGREGPRGVLACEV